MSFCPNQHSDTVGSNTFEASVFVGACGASLSTLPSATFDVGVDLDCLSVYLRNVILPPYFFEQPARAIYVQHSFFASSGGVDTPSRSLSALSLCVNSMGSVSSLYCMWVRETQTPGWLLLFSRILPTNKARRTCVVYAFVDRVSEWWILAHSFSRIDRRAHRDIPIRSRVASRYIHVPMCPGSKQYASKTTTYRPQ